MIRLLVVLCMVMVAGCATVPPPPPEIRTTIVTRDVPVPVPCFTEDQRPVIPKPTPIDLETATVDQMAAALAADNAADDIYARAVDALFVQCMKAAGKEFR